MNQSWKWPIVGVLVAIAIRRRWTPPARLHSVRYPIPVISAFLVLAAVFGAGRRFYMGSAARAMLRHRRALPALRDGRDCRCRRADGALNPAAAPHHAHSLWRILLLVGGTTIPVALLPKKAFSVVGCGRRYGAPSKERLRF